MAEYGWNMKHRNMYGFNLGHREWPPYNPTQNIVCQFCGHVFVSTQALINHIESHMVEEEVSAASRRAMRQHVITNLLPSQTDHENLLVNSIMPNYFATNFPTPSRGTRPLFIDRLGPQPLVQPSAPPARPERYNNNRVVVARPFQPPLQVSPMARNIDSFAPIRFVPPAATAALQAQTTNAAEEGWRNQSTTRPYLNQLDHPIRAMVEVVEIEEDDNDTVSGLNELDLALKL